jgi:hypothetical protein
MKNRILLLFAVVTNLAIAAVLTAVADYFSGQIGLGKRALPRDGVPASSSMIPAGNGAHSTEERRIGADTEREGE